MISRADQVSGRPWELPDSTIKDGEKIKTHIYVGIIFKKSNPDSSVFRKANRRNTQQQTMVIDAKHDFPDARETDCK